MALNDFSVLNQKSHSGDPNKMRGSKEFLCIHFFSCKFYVQFSWRSYRQLWHLTFFRGKKFKTIYLSEHKSVSPKRNAKRHLKLTQKIFTISPFLKNMVLFVNYWPHTVDTPTEGSSVWGTSLSSHVIKYYCYYNIKVDWNVLTRIHYKTLTTVF